MSAVEEFVYVGDPMCSWCWGFAPTIEALEPELGIPVRVVVGGLRPGGSAEPLNDRMRQYLGHHWEQVAERSGQPFDHSFLDREGWVYDTELPAIAIVTMREMAPAATLRFFTRLQRAFYAEAIDITDPSAYVALLDGFDVDRETFLSALGSEAAKRAAWKDFAEARQLGASGFPTLLLDEGERMVIVTRGWAPRQALVDALRDHLAA